MPNLNGLCRVKICFGLLVFASARYTGSYCQPVAEVQGKRHSVLLATVGPGMPNNHEIEFGQYRLTILHGRYIDGSIVLDPLYQPKPAMHTLFTKQ